MTAIRPLVAADIPVAAAAIRRSDWGDRTAFLRFAVAHPACRPFAIDEDGEIVGTGLATVSGAVGWVGLIWVRPDRRGHGLGTALSARAVAELEAAGCRTQVLVATEQGRPIYERLGFRELSRDHILVAPGLPAAAVPDPALRMLTPADMPAVETLDRAATGEDRSHLLRIAGHGWVAGGPGEVRAFSLVAPAGGVAVVAPDPDDALRLLELRRRLVGEAGRARANVMDENRDGLARLAAAGWEDAWSGTRMIRGEPLAWQPTAIWGVFGHALG